MELNSAKRRTEGKVDLARPDEHETERKWEFNKNQLLLVSVKLHWSYPLPLTTTQQISYTFVTCLRDCKSHVLDQRRLWKSFKKEHPHGTRRSIILVVILLFVVDRRWTWITYIHTHTHTKYTYKKYIYIIPLSYISRRSKAILCSMAVDSRKM